MIRDVLAARLRDTKTSAGTPDYQRLAREVLGIHGAPADLARRLVEQALVVEDRRESWRRVGERVCAGAPAVPGVYVFRDAGGEALYVGKAANLRRRLGAHFVDSRWRALVPAIARVTDVEWTTTGSELEALLLEARLIADLKPAANSHVGQPDLRTRAVPPSLVRDVLLLLPSVDQDAVELVAAQQRGDAMILRTARNGDGLVETCRSVWNFFHGERSDALPLAPLVFSWMAGRGRATTRVDPHDVTTAEELGARLGSLLGDPSLFVERLVMIR